MEPTKKEQQFLKIIGQRITHLREESGLSVQELADMAILTRMHLYRIEAGNTPAGILVLRRITLALKADLCELFKK